MEKFHTLLVQFFVRGIWESPLFLFGTLYLAGTQIRPKKFILSSFMLAFIAILVRELPISYGIHTMIILICLNLIALLIFRVNLEQSIKSSVIITCYLFAVEGLNGWIIQLLCGKSAFSQIINDPIKKVYYFIPSTILFIIFDLSLYFIVKKRRTDRLARETKQSDCE